MSAAKVELGRYLFYDKRLSVNGTQSCGSCHRQELAFTDGRARAVGSTGEEHPRSSMSLVNVAYAPALTWAHPTLRSLEEQARVPMFGTAPVELGLSGLEAEMLDRLRSSDPYPRLFHEAFPEDQNPFTVERVTDALACFERSIISARSPYDRYHFGRDDSAVSDAVKRGEILFFSGEKAGCFQCHGGVNFSGPLMTTVAPEPELSFHNTGLYNLQGTLSYPAPNPGLYTHTSERSDVGKFRAPTLRNIAVTAPYMHDGSVSTLDEVIDHYAAAGRTIDEGPFQGIGHDNPNKSLAVNGFQFSLLERTDLLAFLRSLTDEQLLVDPRWSNPWQ